MMALLHRGDAPREWFLREISGRDSRRILRSLVRSEGQELLAGTFATVGCRMFKCARSVRA